jgi:hypothetical protein
MKDESDDVSIESALALIPRDAPGIDGRADFGAF